MTVARNVFVTLALGLAALGCQANEPQVESAETPSRRIYITASDALADGAGTEDRFLIYLHGAILELGERRPTHPERGTYEYDLILQAFADAGVVVISEHRPQGTVVAEYAEKAADEVRALLAAGVPPGQVTVVGFSKGGVIALRTSELLGRDDVRFVFLAACGSWLEEVSLDVRGVVLSIHEESDVGIGSCRGAVERSATGPVAFEEILTRMGGGHGAFFAPRDAWLEPAVRWALGGTPAASER